MARRIFNSLSLGNTSKASILADSWQAPFIGGRGMVEAAEGLRRDFGDDAIGAALLRAALARAQDNPFTYCKWKEVERLLDCALAPGEGVVRH